MPILTRTFLLRFLILFFCALIPLVLFAALVTPSAGNLQEIAQRTANELDRLIELREREVFTIAALPSIRAFASSPPEGRSARAAVALNELQAWVAADTSVRQAFVTDAAGIVIMTTSEGWNSDMSERAFVQDALHGQLAVSPTAQDNGEFSTYYTAPILNNSKKIAGALMIRVAAQEMWAVTPHGENFYAILSDENGVRLDDTGNPAERLTSFAPLDAQRTTRIVSQETYGALLLAPRATNLAHAQELVTQGAFDQLRASDLQADALAYQRLVSKPWVVFVLSPQANFGEIFARVIIPGGVAFLLALGGAFLLSRT